MTPNERELGGIETTLKQIAHKQRNTAMIIMAIQEEQSTQRAELSKLRVTLRTTLAVIAVIVAALAWAIELALRIKP